MATLALGALGAALGPYGHITSWAGFQIGAAIGGYIDAENAIPDTVVGKLSDLRASSSSYGTRLPWCWGRVTLPGVFIWAATDAEGNHLKGTAKNTRTGGSGGGQNQEIWAYSSTFAVGLAQSSIFAPDLTNPIGGAFIHRSPVLKRVRANDVVIYDSSLPSNVIVPAYKSGTETQTADSTIASIESQPCAFRGISYFVLTDFQLKDFGDRIPNFSVEIETSPVTVGDILGDLFRSVGIQPAEFDVSLATASVPGFLVTARQSVQDAVNQLLTAYALDLIEVDGKIVVKPRGGAVVATITAGELAATTGSSVVVPLSRNTTDKRELPQRVDISFYDIENNHQAGLSSFGLSSSESSNIDTYALALSMSRSSGRAMAARLLDTRHIEDTRFKFSLPTGRLALAPGDVINVPTEAGLTRVRLIKIDLAPLAEIRCEAVSDLADVSSQTLPGGTVPAPGDTAYTVVPSEFVVWSGREILDSHQDVPGFYVAASGATNWSGCSVYYSTDGGSNWILGGDIAVGSPFGTATITNYAGAAETIGGSATVVVTLDTQESLESCSASEIEQGTNWALVGSEYVAIRDYNLTAARTYSASTIKRGLRQTVMTGHVSNERFVSLTGDIRRIGVADSLVGATIQVKCVSRFQTIADVTAKSVTITARTPKLVDNLAAMSFVTLSGSAATANERILTAGANTSLVDGGAGSTITVAALPSGATTQIQYNSGGAFAGSSSLTFTVGSSLLTVGGGGTFGGAIEAGAGSFVSGKSRFYSDAALGTVFTGKTGTTYDMAFASSGGSIIFANPTGTSDFRILNGALVVQTNITLNGHIDLSVGGSFLSGVNRLYHSASLGFVISASKTGTTNDFTVVAANGTNLMQCPTGTRNLTLPNGSLTVQSGITATTGAITATAGAINGKGFIQAISTKTTAYTLVSTDHVILCNTSGGAFTVTLPTAVGRTGQIYVIKKITTDANAVTIATTSSQTIDGATTVVTSTAYASYMVVSNGANWLII